MYPYVISFNTEYKAVFKRSLLVVTKETTGETPEDGYSLGSTINYIITVTNSGEVTITDITVTDELTKDEWTIDSLNPGDSEQFNASYTVSSVENISEEVNVGGKWGPTPGGKETVKKEGLGSIPWVVFALKKEHLK